LYLGIEPPVSAFPLKLDAWRILDEGIRRRVEAGLEDDRFRQRRESSLVQLDTLPSELRDAPLPPDARLLLKHLRKPHVFGELAHVLSDMPGSENRVKRAVIMADGKLVSAGDLDLQESGEGREDVLNIKAAREEADRRVIRHALARSEGNISSTAKMLGISRPTLYDLLKQYDLQA